MNKKFKCLMCEKEFTLNKKQIEGIKGPFLTIYCGSCKKESNIDSSGNLNMDKEIEDFKNNKFTCFICEKNFSLSEDEYETIEKFPIIIRCDDCAKKYDTNRFGQLIEDHEFEIEKYKSRDFKKCEEIYISNFVFDELGVKGKGAFNTKNKDNKIFIMKISGEIIGFGGYQKSDNHCWFIRPELKRHYNFNFCRYKKEFDNFIIDSIKKENIRAILTQLSRENDVEYYVGLGFEFYKDFINDTPEMYENTFGLDVDRFALNMYL